MSKAPIRHGRLRREVVEACRSMNELGINQGTSGNLGMRVDGGILVTPTGIPYDAMTPQDIVLMDSDGAVAPGQRKPSSEWRFHRDILDARPEVGAVVHTHAMFATVLACHHMEIPAFHYMVAVAGGDSIRCAPYATFGTQALSDHALRALEDRKACLLANHGMIALGQDLTAALALAVEVETLAAQYWRALQIGVPKLLPADEMQVVLEKFGGYGQQPAEQKGD
jgi:L-fuculose-phosphate aldolase